jgi:hypothetical protein
MGGWPLLLRRLCWPWPWIIQKVFGHDEIGDCAQHLSIQSLDRCHSLECRVAFFNDIVLGLILILLHMEDSAMEPQQDKALPKAMVTKLDEKVL